MEYVTMNNGNKCPVIGLGTFMIAPADAEASVREALKMGYACVDTANAYVNERAVGRGIRESGVPREKIFLSTKLWGGICGKLSPLRYRSIAFFHFSAGKSSSSAQASR